MILTGAHRLFACTAIMAALAGCASAVYEGRYAWSDGWREAEVVRLGRASELGDRHSLDCRYLVPQGVARADRYAVVSYRAAGRQRRAVVPANQSESFVPGDAVYANVRECSESALVRR